MNKDFILFESVISAKTHNSIISNKHFFPLKYFEIIVRFIFYKDIHVLKKSLKRVKKNYMDFCVLKMHQQN